jgi:ABC-type sulfate transport system permease component
MKILIWLGVSYLIQLLLVVFMVYAFNRKVKTVGQLASALSEIPWVLWIPVLGLFLALLSGLFNLIAEIWPRLSRIRIRK